MLKQLRAKLSEISSMAQPKQWLISWLGTSVTASKVDVTWDTSLQISTVYACVYAISDDISKLPLRVYRRDAESGDEEEVRGHPIAQLFRRPNPDMTGKVFRAVMQHHLLLWGNAFAEIVFDGAGRPVGLYPIEPWRVWIEVRLDGSLLYHVHNTRRRDITLEPAQILHLKGLSRDGIEGISVLRAARETMGLSIASERAAANLYANGMMPAGILKHPGKLSPQAEKNLKQSMIDRNGGASRAGEPMILQEAMSYEVLGMPFEDAQFIETRKLSQEEICRYFRCPPHIVGILDRATNNNIEHQGLEYVTFTLLGHARNWEEEVEAKLAVYFPNSDALNVEHDMDELLRGDVKARGEYYTRLRQWGLARADDIRRWEKLPSFGGVAGNQILVPVNMTTPERLEAGLTAIAPPRPDRSSSPVDGTLRQALATDILQLVLRPAVRRCLHTEQDKVRRAVRAGAFEALSREWYPGHEIHVAQQIEAAIADCAPQLARLGAALPADQTCVIAVRAAGQIRGQSLAEASDPELVERWTADRAQAQADEIVGMFAAALQWE